MTLTKQYYFRPLISRSCWFIEIGVSGTEVVHWYTIDGWVNSSVRAFGLGKLPHIIVSNCSGRKWCYSFFQVYNVIEHTYINHRQLTFIKDDRICMLRLILSHLGLRHFLDRWWPVQVGQSNRTLREQGYRHQGANNSHIILLRLSPQNWPIKYLYM
jgi:hypothetical protein